MAKGAHLAQSRGKFAARGGGGRRAGEWTEGANAAVVTSTLVLRCVPEERSLFSSRGGGPGGGPEGGGARPYKDSAPPSVGFSPLPGREAARRPIAGEELRERPPPKGEARRRLLGGDAAARARALPGTPLGRDSGHIPRVPGPPSPFSPAWRAPMRPDSASLGHRRRWKRGGWRSTGGLRLNFPSPPQLPACADAACHFVTKSRARASAGLARRASSSCVTSPGVSGGA